MIAWVLWMLGCFQSTAFAQTLQVGVVTPGADAPDASAIARAVEIFEAHHRNVEVTVVSDDGDTTKATEVATSLVDGGVAGVVGHTDAASAEAAAGVYGAAGVPFLAPALTDRAAAKGSPLTFTTSYTDDVQAARIVAYAAAVLKANNVAVLHADDAQSTAMARTVRSAARRVGLQVQADTASWSASGGPQAGYVRGLFPDARGATPTSLRRRLFGPRQPSAVAQKIGIDAFVVIGDGDAGTKIIGQLRSAGLDVPVVGTDRWDTPAFAGLFDEPVEDVYLPARHTWAIDSDAVRAWRTEFEDEVAPTVAALQVYEGLQLLAAALADERTDAAGVASFLTDKNTPEGAVEGLSSLLYFDRDGVMKRDPWFLSPRLGALQPAYTQLREVVDPRELWRANRSEEEAKAAAEGAQQVQQRIRGFRRRGRTAPGVVEPTGPNVVSLGSSNTVKLGGTPYHLTSVVYAGIDFFRVNDVDANNQSFDVELYLWFKWQGDVDIENIGFINEIYTEEGVWEVLREDLEGDTKYVCFKIKGRFLTPFELREFPFDTQRFPLTLAHESRDSNNLILVVDQDQLSHDAVRDVYPEEWTWMGRADFSSSYVPSSTFGDPAYEGPASRSTYSVYQTEIVLKRILFPYLVTLFLPLVIMVAISLFGLLIPPQQFDARMTLVMTALLSILVFHLAQGDSLPNVGYLMRADQYFMVTYLLMFVLIVKTVLVNMVADDRPAAWVRMAELVFAAVFVPFSFLLYGALTFGFSLPFVGGGGADAAEAVVVEEVSAAIEETPDEDAVPTEGDAAEEAGDAAAPTGDGYTVLCNGQKVALGSVVAPILEDMESIEIPYTQNQAGGDALRDCSGNFLRVSSWVATQCPEGADKLAASAGVTKWRKGGDNVFKGEVKSWVQVKDDGTEQNYTARTSRSTARWYHSQGLYTPIFADNGKQDITTPSQDLQKHRNQFLPGTVVWFAKPGARVTRREGVEKMFSDTDRSEAITHVGVIHSVTRDDDGNVVGYRMYHGRRAYGSSDPDKQDNKITDHVWEYTGSTSGIPPFGNWTEPVVGIAPILPPA
ncbi:MAG: ABC transporter substrate-binding protein [Myxococcales bacterium]|nr:ABC transporter substrate-binding protein [Myxococcales bacterium]